MRVFAELTVRPIIPIRMAAMILNTRAVLTIKLPRCLTLPELITKPRLIYQSIFLLCNTTAQIRKLTTNNKLKIMNGTGFEAKPASQGIGQF